MSALDKARDVLGTVLVTDMRLVKVMSENVDASDLDRVGSILVTLAETTGVTLPVIKTVVESEFERFHNSPTTLLRLNSLASKMMVKHSLSVGSAYLKEVLSALCTEVVSNKALNLEVDSRKLGMDAAAVEQNARFLGTIAQRFLDAITDPRAISGMPPSMRDLAAFVGQQAEKYAIPATPIVGSFIMLRFFSPAISMPEKFGLLPKELTVTPKARRNMVLITKLLQSLSNNAVVEKEEYMRVMNMFITTNQPKMNGCLASLVQGTTDIDKKLAASKVHSLTEWNVATSAKRLSRSPSGHDVLGGGGEAKTPSESSISVVEPDDIRFLRALLLQIGPTILEKLKKEKKEDDSIEDFHAPMAPPPSLPPAPATPPPVDRPSPLRPTPPPYPRHTQMDSDASSVLKRPVPPTAPPPASRTGSRPPPITTASWVGEPPPQLSASRNSEKEMLPAMQEPPPLSASSGCSTPTSFLLDVDSVHPSPGRSSLLRLRASSISSAEEQRKAMQETKTPPRSLYRAFSGLLDCLGSVDVEEAGEANITDSSDTNSILTALKADQAPFVKGSGQLALANFEADPNEPNADNVIEATLPHLFALTTCSDTASQLYAVDLLQKLCITEDHKMRLVKKGVIPVLLTAAIQSESEAVRAKSTDLTTKLAANEDIRPKFFAQKKAIEALMTLTRYRDSVVRSNVARTLHYLSEADIKFRKKLIVAGAIDGLARIYKTGDENTKKTASGSLCTLLDDETFLENLELDVFRELLGTGIPEIKYIVVPHLAGLATDVKMRVRILQTPGLLHEIIEQLDTAQADVSNQAIRTLSLLSCDMDARMQLVHEGSVKPLLALTQGEDLVNVTLAVQTIANLCQDQGPVVGEIVKEDVVPLLVKVLQKSIASTPRDEAARALGNIASGNVQNAVIVANSGAIKPLITMMEGNEPTSRFESTRAIACLALSTAAVQRDLVVAGALPPLIRAGHSVQERNKRDMAIAKEVSIALSNLVANAENRDAVLKGGGLDVFTALVHWSNREIHTRASCGLRQLLDPAVVNSLTSAQLLAVLSANVGEVAKIVMDQLASMCENARQRELVARESGVVSMLLGYITNNDMPVPIRTSAAHAFSSLTLQSDIVAKVGEQNQNSVVLTTAVSSQSLEIQRHMTESIANLTELDKNRRQIIQTRKGLSLLLSLLGVEDVLVQRAAARATANMCLDTDTATSIVREGALSGLVILATEWEAFDEETKRTMSPRRVQDAEARLHAGSALARICNLDIVLSKLDMNSVTQLLTTGIPDIVEQMVTYLADRANAGEKDRLKIIQAPEALLWIFLLLNAKRKSIRLQCARALVELTSYQRTKEVAHDENGLEALLRLLSSEEDAGEKYGVKALADLTTDHSGNVEAFVELGGIPAVLKLCCSCYDDTKLEAARVLANISSVRANADKIVEEGGIVLLITLAGCGLEDVECYVARAFAAIASSCVENQRVMIAEGAIPALIRMARNNTKKSKQDVATTLDAMARVGEQEQAFEENAVDALTLLASNKNKAVASRATEALEVLTSHAGDASDVGHVILQLVALLMTSNADNVLHSLRRLDDLARERTNQPLIVKAGGLRGMIPLLNSDNSEHRLLAIECVAKLAENSLISRDIGDTGAVERLLANLSGLGRNSAVVRESCFALANLMRSSAYNRAILFEKGGIGPVMSLLNCKDDVRTRREAASILASIVEQPDIRSYIVGMKKGLESMIGMLRNTDVYVQLEGTRAMFNMVIETDLKVRLTKEGFLEPTIFMLQSGNEETIALARATLMRYCQCDAFGTCIVNELPLPMLFILMRCGLPEVVLPALQAVVDLTKNNTFFNDEILRSKDLTILVNMLGSENRRIQILAGKILAVLSVDMEGKNRIVENGAALPLVAMIRSDDTTLQQLGALILANLAHGSHRNCSQFHSMGAFAALLNLCNSSVPQILYQAVRGVSMWAVSGDPTNQHQLVTSGGLRMLVRMGGSTNERILMVVAPALSTLAATAEMRPFMKESGAVNALQALVRSPNERVRQYAGQGLSFFSSLPLPSHFIP